MQTKYKLDKHIKAQALWVVRGYKAEQIKYRNAKEEIMSFGSKNFTTHINELAKGDDRVERVYITGGGYSGSQTEDKALRLLALEESYSAQTIRAVDKAKTEMLQYLPRKEARKILEELINCCVMSRNYNFTYSGINSIQRSRFYQYRAQFLYIVAKEMKFI